MIDSNFLNLMKHILAVSTGNTLMEYSSLFLERCLFKRLVAKTNFKIVLSLNH